MPDLLGQQQCNAHRENSQGEKPVMVPAKAVCKGVCAYHKRKDNHTIFKKSILNKIKTQHWQAGKQ